MFDLKTYAQQHGLNYADLLEKIVWRTYCLTPDDELKDVVEGARGMIEDEEAARRWKAQHHYIGVKYDPNLNIKSVAQRVRAEIKELVPDIKTTVRFRRYAGGQSLRIILRFYPGGDADTYVKRLHAIANQYNFDKSGYMDDNHDSNFSLSIDDDVTWRQREKQNEDKM